MNEILKNKAKSELDKWYSINARLKIIRAKNEADTKKPSQENFRFIIGIPTDFRTGIYPKEIELTGLEDSEKWGCYWYDMYETEPTKEMKRLVKLVRDQNKTILHLRKRNTALETRFTKTIFEQEFKNNKKESEKIECESCLKEIIMKESIEGKDFIWLSEGGIMHLECAVNDFNSHCDDCGIYFESESEECINCGSLEIYIATKDEIKKGLQYDAVKHYLPEELQNRVKII